MQDEVRAQAAYWYSLGRHEAQTGNLDLAIQHMRQAAKLEPDNLSILLDLGNTHAEAGQYLPAIESLRKILQINPEAGQAWNNLGNIFFNLRDIENASACYANAVRIMPNEAIARFNLGRVLTLSGHAFQAHEHLTRACALDPGRTDSWIALGKTEQHLGHWDGALACFDRALAISPGLAEAHVNRAVVLLNQGNFLEGWREYEHRWQTESFHVYQQRSFGKPEWKGEPIAGKRILLHTEQGFGDAIQFARFIPAVTGLGADVYLEVRAPLQDLLSQLVPHGRTIVAGQTLPEFDYHCSFVSLARVLAIDFASLPRQAYLSVPAPLVESVRAALEHEEQDRAPFRVGLAWRGNPSHAWDALRSLAPAQLAPLGSIPGVEWYSLQNDATVREIEAWPQGFRLNTLSKEQLEGFQRMAAVIAAMDLVVSVDTAQAHLTGAMGRPIWLLLPLFYEWRWHSHLENSPWYPSARLFRQKRPGEWDQTIASLGSELAALMQTRSRSDLG
jgi:Flp pilus assembly protein TadD